jgi:hypothetical protein
MSKPRRPKGESDAATRVGASARAEQPGTGTERSALMDAFMLGTAPTATAGSDDRLAQPLRTVTKKSETTKLKALGEIEDAVLLDRPHHMNDAALLPYVTSIADVFRQCVHHESVAVRASASAVMLALLLRSRDVKVQLAPELGGIVGPILCCCNDVDSSVAHVGQKVFDALFPSDDKFASAIVKIRAPVAVYLTDAITQSVQKPLSNDPTDPRTIAFVASVGGVTTLFKKLAGSEDQAVFLLELLSQPPFPALIPSRGARGGPLAKCPTGRLSVLRLCAVASDALPSNEHLSRQIGEVASNLALDRDAAVVNASWAALLLWMKRAATLPSDFLASGWPALTDFVAEIASSSTNLDANEALRLEHVLSSLLPFLLLARKHDRDAAALADTLLSSLTSSTHIASQATSVREGWAAATVDCWSLAKVSEVRIGVVCELRVQRVEWFAAQIQKAAKRKSADVTELLASLRNDARLASALLAAAWKDGISVAAQTAKEIVGLATTAKTLQFFVPAAGVVSDEICGWLGTAAFQALRKDPSRDDAVGVLLADQGRLLEFLLNTESAETADRGTVAVILRNSGNRPLRQRLVEIRTREAVSMATRHRDWRSAVRVAAAQDDCADAVEAVVASMESELRSATSIEQLLPGLQALAELTEASSASATVERCVQSIPDLVVTLMPAWHPLTFADHGLEDDETADADDDVASEGSEGSQAESEHSADEGLSGNQALQATNDALALISTISRRVPAAASVMAQLHTKIVASVLAAEGDDECAAGRPAFDVIESVMTLAPEAAETSRLRDGRLMLQLVDDCLADLEDEKEATQTLIERGTYAKHALLRQLFLRPTAAIGLALASADAAVRAGAVPINIDAWVELLTKCVSVQTVLSHRTHTALRSLAKDVLGRATFENVSRILSSIPERGVSLMKLVAPVHVDWAFLLLQRQVEAALGDRSAATLHLAARAALALGEERVSERDLKLTIASASVSASFDQSSSPLQASVALRAARFATTPVPLNAAVVRKLAQLRTDGGGRADPWLLDAFGASMLLPCTDSGVSGEVAVEAERALAKAYSLHHLPTNGKLGQRPPQAARWPPETLRRFAVVLKSLRQGANRHHALFGATVGSLDSLRASVNLALFDLCCECVFRLKDASATDVARISDALEDVVRAIADVQRTEVKSLRASPTAVTTITQLVVNLHFWICSRHPNQIEEEIGEHTMHAIVAFGNRLSGIVLSDSTAPASLVPLLPVISRAPVRHMSKRHPGSTGEVKTRDARRHLTHCGGTAKTRLSLLTYFGAWYACLTNESALVAAARAAESTDQHQAPLSIESKESVYQLLDVILALAHARPVGTTGGRTFLTHAPSNLGFAFSLLGEDAGETGTKASVDHLASCSFALLTLVLQRRTVRHARAWLDTLAKSVRVQFEAFVCRHLSPAITQSALAEILAHSPTGAAKFTPENVPGEVSVTVSETDRTVAARFTADEVSFEVKIMLPDNYPLQPPILDKESIKARARVGVAAEKWRAWMMKVSLQLLSGGFTVWQSIVHIATNINNEIEGAEPCPICYSVIAPANQKLPDMTCVVCKNKFHNTCIYEWWGNSGQSSCPMCRSPWFS